MKTAAPSRISIEVTMFSGDKIAYGPFELPRMFFHRYLVIHYILFCFFAVVVDSRGTLVASFMDDRVRNIGLIALSVALGNLLFALMALVLDLIAYWKGTVRIHGSPYLFAGSVVVVFVDSAMLSGALPWQGILIVLIYYYVLVEAQAHFLALVVVPRLLTDLRRRKAAAVTEAAEPVVGPQVVQDADHIEIGAKRIKADALVRVMAEGNYLRVITQDERLYLPGPFGAAVDPLPERLGVRVSRSDWVAAKAARAIRRDGREMFVVLEDGTAVRVANSRQKVVLSVLNLPVERGRMDALDQGPGVLGGGRRSIQTG